MFKNISESVWLRQRKNDIIFQLYTRSEWDLGVRTRNVRDIETVIPFATGTGQKTPVSLLR